MDRPPTMIEDLLDDYLFLYGTDDGVRKLKEDTSAYLAAAIACGGPLPTADELYTALKTKPFVSPAKEHSHD